MNVTIVSEAWPLSPRVSLEMNSLRRSHNVNVLAWNRGDSVSREFVKFYEKNYEDKFGVIRGYPLFLAWVLKCLLNVKPDVVHCTHLLILPVAIAYKQLTGGRVVYDTYERYGLLWSEHFDGSKGIIKTIVDRLEVFLSSFCDCVLTTDSRGNVLERRFRGNCESVYTLYNVPSLKSNSGNGVSVDCNIIEKIDRNFTVACVGGLSKKKGVVNLINAVEIATLCENMRLLLIGKFKDILTKKYIENKSSIKNLFIHLEWLEYEVMMEYLKKADVGVVPYPPEPRFQLNSTGTSRKFFTYMEASIPIVGPKKWEIGQVVRNAGNGLLVDTKKPLKIASAILRLKRNSDERKKMSKRGEVKLENKYNWEEEEKKLMEAYSNL